MPRHANTFHCLCLWCHHDSRRSYLKHIPFVVEILIREKEPLTIARKITGRAGNKTVVCGIWPDDEMIISETYSFRSRSERVSHRSSISLYSFEFRQLIMSNNLATDIVKDEYGIEHPVGIVERVDMITNPLAPINRTIPMIPKEGSVYFRPVL